MRIWRTAPIPNGCFEPMVLLMNFMLNHLGETTPLIEKSGDVYAIWQMMRIAVTIFA